MRGNDFEAINRMATHIVGQRLSVGSVFLREEMKTPAPAKRGKDRRIPEICRECRKSGEVGPGRKREFRGNPAQVVEQLTMLNGNALRLPRGSGGVDYVYEVFDADRRQRIHQRLQGDRFPVGIQTDRPDCILGNALDQVPLCQQYFDPGILEHEQEPFGAESSGLKEHKPHRP